MPAKNPTPGKPQPKKRARKRVSRPAKLFGFVPTQPSTPAQRKRAKRLEDAVATATIETEPNDWYEE